MKRGHTVRIQNDSHISLPIIVQILRTLIIRSECSSRTRFVGGSVCLSVCLYVSLYVCNTLAPLPFPPLPSPHIFLYGVPKYF